jgi:RNA polymerase sigma-70 factor (ECF subfamily)
VSLSPPEIDAPIDSETLFKRHAGFVASFLYRLGVPDADLEDLVQEVFMTAHRKGGYLPGTASPTTFLARLALEQRLAHRRRDARWQTARGETLAKSTVGAAATTPEQDLALQRAAHGLQRVLDAMEPGVRSVFVLFELEGEPCEAIAAGLGIKLGTVYSRLHRARETFHEHARSER